MDQLDGRLKCQLSGGGGGGEMNKPYQMSSDLCFCVIGMCRRSCSVQHYPNNPRFVTILTEICIHPDDGFIFIFIFILMNTVQITFIFIDFRVCDFAFAFKTQNAPCVSRFKRVLFSDRFQFAF